jgi:hypothetical protein
VFPRLAEKQSGSFTIAACIVECGELVENLLGCLKDLDVFVRKNSSWNSGFEGCLRKGLGFAVFS